MKVYTTTLAEERHCIYHEGHDVPEGYMFDYGQADCLACLVQMFRNKGLIGMFDCPYAYTADNKEIQHCSLSAGHDGDCILS